MAGHALLKIIAGFAWSLMNCSSFLFLAYLIQFCLSIVEENRISFIGVKFYYF